MNQLYYLSKYFIYDLQNCLTTIQRKYTYTLITYSVFMSGNNQSYLFYLIKRRGGLTIRPLRVVLGSVGLVGLLDAS